MCQNGKPHNHDDFFDSRMEIEVNAWVGENDDLLVQVLPVDITRHADSRSFCYKIIIKIRPKQEFIMLQPITHANRAHFLHSDLPALKSIQKYVATQ